jgi:hypothetical protein
MSDDVPPITLRTPSRLALWWKLPRALGLATDGRKLILAAVGLMVMWAGWDFLDRVFPTSSEITAPAVARTTSSSRAVTLADHAVEAFRQAADPVRMLASPVIATFELPSNDRRFLHAVLAILWAVIVWAPVGGAIARIAVVESATGSRMSLARAIRFSLYKLGALITAPLSPITGIAFLTALCALFGLLYRIPGPIGVTIAGVLAFLPIGAGVLMTLILIGLIAGWPLMIASVAAEANDGFDALSRAYSYVLQRPGQYAVAIGIVWLFGSLGAALAMLAARLIVHLTIWSVSFGGPDARTLLLFLDGPLTRSTAGSFHYLWVSAIALLAYSWTFSYFWSAAAQMYLLMRSEVDGAPWGDVALPRPDESAPLPLVVSEEIAAEHGSPTQQAPTDSEIQ